jgi:hypothetical protein
MNSDEQQLNNTCRVSKEEMKARKKPTSVTSTEKENAKGYEYREETREHTYNHIDNEENSHNKQMDAS